MTPTNPGQRCKVVGGRSTANGEGQSLNYGKVVTTQFLHHKKAGIEQENVWHCVSSDVLTTYYGAGHEADFLECWLEVLPPEPLKTKETQLELGI
jgi:hypothetical protein